MIPNQAGGVARMSQDEILINDNKTAEAFQYQVILRRSSLADDSPRLALVAAALEIENYQYKVDVSGLPDKYDHEVPQLNQNDVPNIGNQICSPTSSTMLLMFKGHEFSEAFPHEKNARLFRDYGNKIYGNWVYNTVGMSAYGEKVMSSASIHGKNCNTTLSMSVRSRLALKGIPEDITLTATCWSLGI